MMSTARKVPALHQRSRQPPPPAEPCPWLWRCHHCHIIYRVATTRRCLECDHEFCLGAPNVSSNGSRKRKRRGTCKSEFDYVGWAARGAWRRTLFLNTDNNNDIINHNSEWKRKEEEELESGMLISKGRWISPKLLSTEWGDEYRALLKGGRQSGTQSHAFGEKKDAMFVRKRHDCWLHCDFPSECHHAMYQAQQEGRPTLGRAMAVDEAYVVLKKVKRARDVTGGSVMVEEECSSEATDGDDDDDNDGKESRLSSTPSSPPQIDDKSDQIQIINGEEDHLVDIYLEDPQTQMENELYLRESKNTPTAAVDVKLEGDYSYESFKQSLRPCVSERELNSASTAITGLKRTTPPPPTSSSSSSSLPSLPFLGALLEAEAQSQREGRESPPLSPFSLAKKGATEAIMSCHHLMDQLERDAVVPAAKVAREDLSPPSSAIDDDGDEDMEQDFEGGKWGVEDEDGENVDKYEESLDELLNALFNKTSSRTPQQDPTATTTTGRGGATGRRQQLDSVVAIPPEIKYTSLSLPRMPANYSNEEEGHLLGGGDVAANTEVLLKEAYSDQSWLFPGLGLGR